MEQNLLNEYRCSCGKLLFKGVILVSIVEIKCKRCGQTKTFRDNMQGVHSFMLVVDGAGKIIDACKGVAVLEYSRQYVIGKSLFDVLPLARDAQYEEIISGLVGNESGRMVSVPVANEHTSKEAYQIRNNTLLLRDRKLPLESHIIPVSSKSGSLYRVFNIIKEA